MADLALEGLDYLEPLEADVRVLRYHRREPETPPLNDPPLHHLADYDMDESLLSTTVPEPIRIRGVGGTTMFGLTNRFDDEFPQSLVGKVAQEEFLVTIGRVNAILQKSIPWNLRCLLCGCLCCCCTFGLSLGPGIYLGKRTMSRIEKLLEAENWRLYNRLSLNWRLSQEQSEHSSLRSYVLLIEFQPKLQLFRPD